MGEGYPQNLGKLDHHELYSTQYEYFSLTCSALSSGFIRYFPLLTTEAVNCLKWVFSRYPSLKDAMATATVVRGRCMLSQN